LLWFSKEYPIANIIAVIGLMESKGIYNKKSRMRGVLTPMSDQDIIRYALDRDTSQIRLTMSLRGFKEGWKVK
jgi:hypothetical protein